MAGTEVDSRVPEGANELRCAAAEFSINCFRYGPACQEELEYSHSERWEDVYVCWGSPSLTLGAGIVSAPLWDSKTSTFAGLLTTSDYINVIQYYWQNPDALARVDQFRLNSLRGKTQNDLKESLI